MNAQRSFGDSTSKKNGGSGDGGSSTSTPNAETSDGGVSVAAAVGVNIAITVSRAYIASGVNIHATVGAFSLTSNADTDARASGSGAASQPPADGSASGDAIGVGVAINYAHVTNVAEIPSTGVVTANGVTVSATMHSKHEFAAEAASGASNADVGVAGSVAINIVTIVTGTKAS